MKRSTIQRSVAFTAVAAGAFHLARRTSGPPNGRRVSRRRLMELAGVATVATVVGGWKTRSSSTALAAPNCILSPEETQGPYYIAREKMRRNIREGRPGVPLDLRVSVVDAATCRPIKGAAVDIWHCDAGGIYSGFMSASTGGPGGSGPTDTHTFLRGIQLTDAKGLSRFLTVYPGWYRGRTVHIHVMVHLGGATVGHIAHTGQLYFSDALTKNVYTGAPYRARAAQRDTFNNTDSVYSSSGGPQSMLTMRKDGHGGYIGTITLGVHRS